MLGGLHLFFLGQMYDVVYYDLRISISSWIMLAALRSIIIEQKYKKGI